MATSRTGTAKWKRVRARAIQQAQAEGITRCPLCGRWLDWNHSLQPSSVEVDHITPWAKGGADDIENVRVICRDCNQRRGARDGKAKCVVKTHKPAIRFGGSAHWNL